MPDTFQPRPYVLSTPQSEIDDLKLRLSKTRYAKEIIPYNAGEEPAGVSFGFGAHGPPLEWIQAFAEEWGNDYDWLEREKEFNRSVCNVERCEEVRRGSVRKERLIRVGLR